MLQNCERSFKDVRVQNFDSQVQIFLKLWLQVENDKIMLKA